jgi:CheY-like chemotaxis protein
MAKILLVEDDNNLREIFEMRLQAEGYQTVVAGDGEEGLVVAMKEKPDLIIADVMMPKLSGFEMLETLRGAPEMGNVKVILMTALGQAEDRARGESLGVVKYLVKSQVTLEDFVRVVHEVLQPAQADAASSAAPATDPAKPGQLVTKQESEKSMPDDNATNQSPTPPADSSGSPSSNPISDAPAGDMGGSSPLSSAQEQGSVQSQINDFVASSPAGGDTPAAPAGGGMPPAGNPASSGDDIPVASPPPSVDPPPPTDPGTPGSSGPTAPMGGTL